MRKISLLLPVILLGIAAGLSVVSCSTDQGATMLSNLSGHVIVGSIATDPATGPGLVTIFDENGQMVSVIRDYYASGTHFPTGLAYLGDFILAIFRETSESLERVNLLTGATSTYSNGNITSNPAKHIVADSSGAIFITESSVNTVEKVDSQNNRVGNPYIATTTGSCVLSAPWGIAINSSTGQLAVISSAAAGRFSLYNSDGTCSTHVTAAPFNSGTPTAICYHSLSNKFIVTFSTSHAIYSISATGGSGTQIYLNSSIINTPRAVACDANGFIFVGSSGTDTVEKLYYDGGASATRVLSGPFAGPGIYTQNPTAITVIP